MDDKLYSKPPRLPWWFLHKKPFCVISGCHPESRNVRRRRYRATEGSPCGSRFTFIFLQGRTFVDIRTSLCESVRYVYCRRFLSAIKEKRPLLFLKHGLFSFIYLHYCSFSNKSSAFWNSPGNSHSKLILSPVLG